MKAFAKHDEQKLFMDEFAIRLPAPICWFDYKIDPETVVINDLENPDPCYRRGLLCEQIRKDIIQVRYFGYFERGKAWVPSTLITFISIGKNLDGKNEDNPPMLKKVLRIRIEAIDLLMFSLCERRRVPTDGLSFSNTAT